MKRVLLFALAWLPGSAFCQDLNGILRGGMEIFERERILSPIPGSKNQQDPAEPRSNPGLPPREGTLPGPQADNRNLIQIVGEPPSQTIRQGNHVRWIGGAHIRYRGYDVIADEVDGDTRTNIFTARGNVKVIGVDGVVRGEVVTVNFDDRTFQAESGNVELRPSFVQGRVLDDIYVKGVRAYGSEREVWGEEGAFTTCNLDHSHFEIEAARVNLRPYRRVILRNVRFKLFDKTLFKLPFMSVPLDESRERYTPDIGQSPDEGYYIKNYIGVPTSDPNDNLTARVDYMTKLGSGLGGNLLYQRALMAGLFKAYAVLGNVDTLNLENDHRQRFGRSELRVKNTFERDNYLNSPNSTIWRSTNSLALGQGTNLSYGRSSNESSGFRSINEVYGLQDQRQLGGMKTSAMFNYVNNSSAGFSGSSTRREELDVRLAAERNLKLATATLEYIRSIPIGETSGFLSSTERTPLLTLKSDAKRLFGEDFNRRLPFNTELSFGEFVAGRTGDRFGRTNFDLNFNRRDNPQNRSTLTLNGRFRQGFYSDDTAQYVTGLNVAYRYGLGKDTSLNLRYSFLRGYGFSPLPIDRVGKTNFLSTDLSIRPFRTLLFGAGTGYDFLLEEREQVAWQTVGFRTEYTPARWLQFRTYSTYDPRAHSFSNVRMDFAYQPGATRLIGGVRWDAIRHTWANANLRVDGFKWGRLLVSSVLAYNGYLKKFEAQHYVFTYDLHCAEAVLEFIDNPVGFRSGRQILFFIRLKALPFDTPFGLGTRGQPIGGGTGRDY